MILRGIVNVLKAIVTGVAKVVAWLLLALGLWLPAIYSVVFFIVCAISETSFSDIRGLFFLGLGLATVLSVWYTLSTNRSKKKKNDKSVQSPTYMSKLKVKEDKVQYKRGEPVRQAAPAEERERDEVIASETQNRDTGDFLPYRRKDYSDYETPVDDYGRQNNYNNYKEERRRDNSSAGSRDMRGSESDSYYRPNQQEDGYVYGQREQNSRNGYQDERYQERYQPQPEHQQYYERPDRDMYGSGDGYGSQQRYGGPARDIRSYNDTSGDQDGFYPYKPREEKRGLSDPPKEKFSSYHQDDRAEDSPGLYRSGQNGRGVDTLFNRDASDRYGFSAYNSSGTKQDYYSQAGWASPRSDTSSAKEMPKIFATRNDKDILIYEYCDRLEYYRKTLAGLRLESVKYKDDNYA